MNEHIDIALTGAKMATRNNPWASIATHTISMGYNVSKLWYYQYQISQAVVMRPGYVTQEQINTFRQERLKHAVLIALDGLGLILSSIGAMQEGRYR